MSFWLTTCCAHTLARLGSVNVYAEGQTHLIWSHPAMFSNKMKNKPTIKPVPDKAAVSGLNPGRLAEQQWDNRVMKLADQWGHLMRVSVLWSCRTTNRSQDVAAEGTRVVKLIHPITQTSVCCCVFLKLEKSTPNLQANQLIIILHVKEYSSHLWGKGQDGGRRAGRIGKTAT